MQEETQKYLDDYNTLYCWEYNEMCDFIEKYGETMFLTHYETYHRLVEDYGMELVDKFADEFDVDCVENFEDMYQGQHETGANFAENICEELGYIKSYQGDLPSWIEIDWEKTWDNLSYDYTELIGGHIFNNNY